MKKSRSKVYFYLTKDQIKQICLNQLKYQTLKVALMLLSVIFFAEFLN